MGRPERSAPNERGPADVGTSATDLVDLFWPSAVAVVGATEDAQQFGGRVFNYLRTGFNGAVHPVNPGHETVQGAATFSTLTDAPHCDVAVIAVRAEHVRQAIRSCGDAGIPWAIVFASGFADAGPLGVRRQHELVDEAQASGVRLIGPNSMGIANFSTGLTASFAARLGQIELQPGGLALVSQSGATGSALLSDLAEARVPCGLFCHTGNEADVTAAAVLRAFAQDPNVTILAAYLETIRDPNLFVDALAIAAGAGKPVVVLKAGISPAGAAAAASHTGALVQPDDAFEAVCDAHGVIRVRAPYELVDVLRCLAPGRRPRGPRMAVVTVSGGGGVMQADAADLAGLDVSPPPAALRRRLMQILPAYAGTNNPFDLTGAPIANPHLLVDTLAAIGELGDYDIVSLHYVAGERSNEAFVNATVDFARKSASCVLATWQGTDPDPLLRLATAGIPTFSDPNRAVAAIGRLVQWARSRAAGTGDAAEGLPAKVSAPVRPVPTETEALGHWLDDRGISLIPTSYLTTASEANEAYARLGPGPLVAKLVLPRQLHRTDVGGVRLNVSSALALATTTEELLHLGHQIEAEGSVRVQVQPQISGGHELLVGLRRDEQFGWMLAIGFGGVLAEIVNEVRILPAPANELACRAAVDTLFRGRWSTHHRGLGPANVRAAAALAARLSAIAIEFDGNELELNPVIVNNGTARAVDWVAAP